MAPYLEDVINLFLSTAYDNYWSSHTHYLNLSSKPCWLFCDWVLDQLRTKHKTLGYKAFVEEQVSDNFSKRYEAMKSTILGDDKFVENVAKLQVNQNIQDKEIPELQSLKALSMCEVDTIIQSLLAHFNATKHDLKKTRSRKDNITRMAGIYLISKHSLLTLKEVGEIFDISYSAVSRAVSTMEKKIIQDQNICRSITEIEAALRDKSKIKI